MVLKYEANLLAEVDSLKSALMQTLGEQIILIDEKPKKARQAGCFVRVAQVLETGGYVELWLDHSSGHKQPMYWCGLMFVGDAGWNHTMELSSQATEVCLGIDPYGRADIGEVADADRITEYDEDYPPDYTTFIEVIPGRYLDQTISHAFPQHNEFYLGCYFTDYSPEIAAAYIGGLCGQSTELWSFREGAVSQRLTNVYERNARARMRCVNSPGGLDCCVCGLNFAERYGNVGQGFIHVHHVLPVSDRNGGSITEVGGLVSVCPNCHAMLHRGGLRTPEELRSMMEAAVARRD